MPVSLIPQERPSRRSLSATINAWTGGDFFVGLSLTVLFVIIATYIGLTIYQARLNGQLRKDNTDYLALQQNRSITDQAQAADFAERSQRIKTLLAAHINADPLFSFLENYTLDKVTWTNLSFDPIAGDLKLQGSSAGYQSVAEQMALWQENSIVRHVSVSDFLVGNDGLLHFSAHLLLSPEAFLPSS